MKEEASSNIVEGTRENMNPLCSAPVIRDCCFCSEESNACHDQTTGQRLLGIQSLVMSGTGESHWFRLTLQHLELGVVERNQGEDTGNCAGAGLPPETTGSGSGSRHEM